MKLNNSLHICITGGAGYIGSHIVLNLLDNTNHLITIIDNLSTGNTQTIDALKFQAKRKNKTLKIVILDLINKNDLLKIFEESNFDAVFHLAALFQGEKNNNFESTKNILECMKMYAVKNLIFSSSATIYESKNSRLFENSSSEPSSPYGKTKLKCEKIIEKFEDSINYINLRFFNVVGCDNKYRVGRSHNPQSKLFPTIAKAIIKNTTFYLNGNSYNTKDGTCVRDFIHVEDLCGYYVAALSYMYNSSRSNTINCGYSKGYSIMEITEVMKVVSKKELNIKIISKKRGDYPSLVADTTMLDLTLGKYYDPIYKNDIEKMCKQVYNWELLKMDMKLDRINSYS